MCRMDSIVLAGRAAKRTWSAALCGSVLALSVLVAGAWRAMAQVGADPRLEIGVAASDLMLWVHQRSPAVENVSGIQFAYESQSGLARGRFQALRLAPVAGQIAHLAVRERDLHVFFSDGTHRRFVATSLNWPTTSARAFFSETNLPGSAVPLCIAVEATHNVLYALVSREVALAIERLEVGPSGATPSAPVEAVAADTHPQEAPPSIENRGTQGEGSPEGDRLYLVQGKPPVANPAVAIPPDAAGQDRTTDDTLTTLEAPTAIVRYELGRWRLDRAGPAEIIERPADCQILVRDGDAHLIHAHSGRGRGYVYRISAAPDFSWSEPTPLEVPDGASLLAFGWGEREPVVIVARGSPSRHRLQVLAREEGLWTPGPILKNGEGGAATFHGAVAAAMAGGNVVVVQRQGEQPVELGRWSLKDGSEAVALAAVLPLLPPPTSFLTPAARVVMQYVVLGTVLAVLFVWRRESVVRPAPLPAALAPARLSLRFVALLIDLLITLPVTGLTLRAMWGVPEEGGGFLSLWQRASAESSGVVFWSSVVVGLIVGVYGILFESLRGATPGKRVVQLTVVNDQGQKCRLAAIVVRNLTRVIEFAFLPVMLLVVLTPSRQRLGDLLARSVVVEHFELDGPPAAPSDERAGRARESSDPRTEDSRDTGRSRTGNDSG